MIRNQAWYNQNETRPYPLDEAATLIDDAGKRLRHHILADLQVRFPANVGRYAYLSAVTVSPGLVTLVVMGSPNPANPGGCRWPLTGEDIPLAALSVAKPIVQGRHYPLEPLYPGVGGWAVLGSGIEEPDLFSLRFSTIEQAMLSPRIAWAYAPLPIPNVAKYRNVNVLAGLVQLVGGNDIEIVLAQRQIENVVREAIVFRLADTQRDAVARNVFDVYRGPCEARPESHTCGNPEPLEFLAGVGPDCCDNIVLELRGCADVAEVLAGNGALLECDLGLIDACLQRDRLPDAEGRLPSDANNDCEGLIDISEFVPLPLPPEVPPDSSVAPVDPGDVGDPQLPHLELFEDMLADDFVVVSGNFLFAVNDGPPAVGIGGMSYATEDVDSASQLNLAIWNVTSAPQWSANHRLATIDFRLMPGPSGAKHDAMLVFNRKPTVANPSTYTFWAAEVSWDEKVLRLAFFNGSEFVGLVKTTVSDLQLGDWYRLSVKILPAAPPHSTFSWLTLELAGLDNPSIAVRLGPTYQGPYAPATGAFGVAAERSHVRFDSFRIEVAT